MSEFGRKRMVSFGEHRVEERTFAQPLPRLLN